MFSRDSSPLPTVPAATHTGTTDHLTVLRFVAAFIVVIYHYGREALGAGGIFGAGPQMVTFFFVLSGFVMVMAYGDRPRLDARRYWSARAVRILPAYLVAMLMALLLDGLLRRTVEPTALALHTLLLQAWWPPAALALNPPGWSLSVEAFFYLAFPFLLPLSGRVSPRRLLMAALLVWFVTQAALLLLIRLAPEATLGTWQFNFILYHPLSHLCSFLLGIAAGFAHRSRQARNLPPQLLWLALVTLLLLVCLGSETAFAERTGLHFAYGASFWAPVFALWIVLLAPLRNGLARALAHPFAKHLGEISYGVYIYQAPLHLAWLTLLPFGDTKSSISFLLFSLALILFAHGSHAWLEAPARRWWLGRQLSQR